MIKHLTQCVSKVLFIIYHEIQYILHSVLLKEGAVDKRPLRSKQVWNDYI